MAKKTRRKKGRGTPPAKTTKRRSNRYTPAEIAMAVLGGLLLIMVAGIIITSIWG